MKKRNKHLVYSTDKGRICPGCGQAAASCRCGNTPVTDGDGIVRLQRQVKGRRGKPVVIITGLSLPPAELKSLSKKLKSKCGVGGTVDGAAIIIQGDKRDLLQAELESMGYEVKLSGG